MLRPGVFRGNATFAITDQNYFFQVTQLARDYWFILNVALVVKRGFFVIKGQISVKFTFEIFKFT